MVTVGPGRCVGVKFVRGSVLVGILLYINQLTYYFPMFWLSNNSVKYLTRI